MKILSPVVNVTLQEWCKYIFDQYAGEKVHFRSGIVFYIFGQDVSKPKVEEEHFTLLNTALYFRKSD